MSSCYQPVNVLESVLDEHLYSLILVRMAMNECEMSARISSIQNPPNPHQLPSQAHSLIAASEVHSEANTIREEGRVLKEASCVKKSSISSKRSHHGPV